MHHQSSRQLQDSPFWATAGLGLPSLAFQGVLKGDCEGPVSVAPERLCSPSVRLCVAHTVTSGRLWTAPVCVLLPLTWLLVRRGNLHHACFLCHGNLVREENTVNYWEECVSGSLCLGKNTTLPGRSKEPETHLRPFSKSVTEITFKRNLFIRTEFCKEFWTSCARSRQDSPNLQPDSPAQNVESREMVKAIFKN